MPFMPFQILGMWLRGLLALALLAASAALLYGWYTHRHIYVTERHPTSAEPSDQPDRIESAAERVEVRRIDWQIGLNKETAYLVGGLALAAWSLAGRWLSPTRLFRRSGEEPTDSPEGIARRIQRPDGTELHVELYGPEDAPPVVLTHGWGLDEHEWSYTKQKLADRHRLIVWDLPGLGRSTSPADNDWSLEKLARDLESVLSLAGGRPAILVGHSIGGMIQLTFCRLFPEALGRRVCGLVLAHSTYTNPVKTTSWAAFYTALQKPVLEPLCHLMVWLAPLVWLMNWLSYLNGSAHRSTERSSFSGHETQGQLDFLTRYYVKAWPGVLARGLLAMFRYDATEVLGAIRVPVLVVTGDQDKTCTPQASTTMSRSIPQAKLITLQPARHCGLFEHHEPFNKAIQEFIAVRTEPLVKAAN